jgi:hypothetical protein
LMGDWEGEGWGGAEKESESISEAGLTGRMKHEERVRPAGKRVGAVSKLFNFWRNHFLVSSFLGPFPPVILLDPTDGPSVRGTGA